VYSILIDSVWPKSIVIVLISLSSLVVVGCKYTPSDSDVNNSFASLDNYLTPADYCIILLQSMRIGINEYNVDDCAQRV